MKIKTSELTRAALNWAVCIANGLKPEDIYIQRWGKLPASLYRRNRDEDGDLDGTYTTGPDLLFSEKWEAGGPIIERGNISTCWEGTTWVATLFNKNCDETWYGHHYGPTPLIAAMRCFVASRLGDEVDVPDEFHTV